jgi:hypothetical protein
VKSPYKLNSELIHWALFIQIVTLRDGIQSHELTHENIPLLYVLFKNGIISQRMSRHAETEKVMSSE